MQLDVEIPSKTNWNLCTSGSDKGQRYLDGTSGSAINSWVRIFSNSSHQIEDLTNLVVSKVVISSDYMVFYMNNGLSVRLHPNISQIFWPIWVETKLQHIGGVNRDVTVRPLSMVWCMCNFFDQIFFIYSRMPCSGSPSSSPLYELILTSKSQAESEKNASRCVHLNPVKGSLSLTKFGLERAQKDGKTHILRRT